MNIMRKLVAVIMSVGLAVIPSLGGFSAETSSVELKGALCLTFDDHYLDSWCRELPRFAKFGAHATFFTSGAISSTDVGKLRQLKADGHSLGLHGQNHTPATDAVTQYGVDGFLAREVDPQLAVCQVAGLDIRSWAYPNSKNDATTDAALATRFVRLRCGGVYRDAIAGDPLSGHDLVFVPRAEAGSKLVLWSAPIPATVDGWQADVRGAIQRAHDNDEVVVFHSHNIRNDNVKDAHDISGEQLEEILQMAADIGVSVIGFDELGGSAPAPEPAAKLPNGYLMLDYIESSGTQYIDTGVTNTSDDIVTIDFYVKPTQTKSMASFIYGARSGGMDRNYSLHVNESTLGSGIAGHMQLNNDNDGVSVKLVHGAAGPVSGARFRTCISRSLRSIENLDTGVFVSNSETAAEYSTGKSAYLFAGNTEGHGKASLRLYSCKIVRAGVTLREFVPCVRSSDMVAGLYDVSGQSEEPFYANQGEGKFAYPGYVHVSYAECTRLEYVRSSGQAYADTGFIAGPDTGFYIRFEPEELTKDLFLLGSMDENSGTAARMRLGRRNASDSETRSEYFVEKADQSSNMESPTRAPQGGVHEILLAGDRAWLDGTTPFGSSEKMLTKTLKNTIWVFNLNNCGQPMDGKGFVGKLYGCTVFNEGQSAVNLLPMKDAAGRVGLYDSAKGVLRFSIGEAMFEPGPEAGACTEATAVELMAVQSVDLTSVRVVYDLVNLAEADGPCDLAFVWTDVAGKTNTQVFAQGVAAAGGGAVVVNDVVAAADLATGGTINGRIVVRSGDRTCAESSAKSVTMPKETGATADYQRLEYVHSNGGWFDTQYSPGPKTAAEMTFSQDKVGAAEHLFGTMTTSGGSFPNRFRVIVRASDEWDKGPYFVDISDGGDIRSASVTPVANVVHTIYASVALKSMDGKADAFSAATPSKPLSVKMDKSLYFGHINNFSTSNGKPLTGNIYGCALYEDGKLVHQYQPAKRLADGVVGFCDTVGGGFYPSDAGDTTFTAGTPLASNAVQIVGGVVYRRDTTVKIRYACKANERVFLAYGRAYGGSALSGWETTGVETGIAGASEGVKKVTLKGVTDATVGYVRVYAVDTDSNQISWGNTYSLPQTTHRAGGFLLMLK